jgi:thiamine-phosphate pyrophosphorylase
MRLKKYSYEKKIIIGKKIKKICKNSNVKFLVNDSPELSKKLRADGCHLGQKDMNIIKARKIIGNKIIGITCHNSINLAKAAIKGRANYIAFGAFFSTKTKKVKYQATTKILDKVKKLTRIPLVAIGGINLSNYKKLLLNNANLLAISGYVWNNKKYKPFEAIEKIK